MQLDPVAVFLTSSDNHVTHPNNAQAPRLSIEQWRIGTRKTLELLDAAGLRTVVLRDTPGPGLDVPTCLARAQARHAPDETCDAPRGSAIREDVFAATLQAASRLRGVSAIDFTDYFCTPTVCPPVLGGTIVYGQPGHISDVFARSPATAEAVALRIIPIVNQAKPPTLWSETSEALPSAGSRTH